MSDCTFASLAIKEYKRELIRQIEDGIEATNLDDEYSVGLRNGMRFCKACIEEADPDYEEVPNNPLTWDELKGMTGEPVWIKTRRYGSRWYLIEDTSYEEMIAFTGLYGERAPYFQDDLGKTWQAYRKERLATGGSLTPEPKSKKLGDDTEIKWSEKNE